MNLRKKFQQKFIQAGYKAYRRVEERRRAPQLSFITCGICDMSIPVYATDTVIEVNNVCENEDHEHTFLAMPLDMSEVEAHNLTHL